ncbi:MAG: hypothetical protein WBB07_07420 [Mycobacterium sp.]
MAEFRDADGVKWTVRRAWWPLLGPLDMASSGTGAFGVVMFVIAVPMILAWPVWMFLKFCGVPWKVVTERDDVEVATEKVGGWRASGRRIGEIIDELRHSTERGQSTEGGRELRESDGVEHGADH